MGSAAWKTYLVAGTGDRRHITKPDEAQNRHRRPTILRFLVTDAPRTVPVSQADQFDILTLPLIKNMQGPRLDRGIGG